METSFHFGCDLCVNNHGERPDEDSIRIMKDSLTSMVLKETGALPSSFGEEWIDLSDRGYPTNWMYVLGAVL